MNIKHLLTAITIAAATMVSANAQWAPTKSHLHMERPDMEIFLPNDDLLTGRAVVALPGGSYFGHAYGHEGVDWAPYFNKQGIALIVVRYTLPEGDYTKPIADAEAAIRTVRDSAAVWGINPADVGIMGSSAGGHLATTVATQYSNEAVRPDFQILFYPLITMEEPYMDAFSRHNFMGDNPSAELQAQYSNHRHVTSATPRAFIAISDDDEAVATPQCLDYYLALYNNKVPASLHIYPTGRHGWGCLDSFVYKEQMISDLTSWLRSF